MDNNQINRPTDTLLDKEIAVALRSAVKSPPADFTDLLMSEIAVDVAPVVTPASGGASRRLSVYLIGLSLALIATVFLLPVSGQSADGSPLLSSSLLWTLCAVGLIAILGLSQTHRFTHTASMSR